MPTILIAFGYRFYFYSNENDEPMHVHVKRGDAEGKVWLAPFVSVAYFSGFKAKEEKEVMQLVEEHKELFKSKWNEHFRKP